MKYSMTILLLVNSGVHPHGITGFEVHILVGLVITGGDLPRLFHTVQLQFVVYSSLFLLRLPCFALLLRSHCINLSVCESE